jgi:vanillate O-demethylase ferredoxin subunit
MTAKPMLTNAAMRLQLRAIRLEAEGICSFELADPTGCDLPPYDAGAHIDVYLPNGLIRPYSLAGEPNIRDRYVLGVLRDPKSTGGSAALHEQVRVGDMLSLGQVRNAFSLHEPLIDQPSHTILLAGGIGITPLKAMAHTLAARGDSFELHYCIKSVKNAAFLNELKALVPVNRLHLHFDGGNPKEGLDIAKLLNVPKTHVYYCGPAGFMKACAAATAHWPSGSVHSEHFKAPDSPKASAAATGGDGSFEVHLKRTGITVQVAADQSIVRAIELAGHRVPTSCLSGLCGACKVNYLEGDVDHRDYILSDADKAQCMTLCVSRAKSPSLTIDL